MIQNDPYDRYRAWEIDVPGGPLEVDPPRNFDADLAPMPRQRPIFEPVPPAGPTRYVPIHAGSALDLGPWVACASEEAARGWDARCWELPWR